jgi:glycosyltransferase involved in cell wall biosynthesis
MFGRAGHQKNVEAAAPILAALPTDTRLTLCGIDTDTPQIRTAFARLTDQVYFAGEVGDVRPHLAQADMFLMTSRYEGMPIGALEAFEAGLPLALPVIPGTAEIRVHHPLMAQIDTGQPVAAAARILAAFEAYQTDPKMHQNHIRRIWAAHFSYDVWARNLRDLVAKLL